MMRGMAEGERSRLNASRSPSRVAEHVDHSRAGSWPEGEARLPRPTLVRKQVRINLLPYGLRWDPPGLERARQLAWHAVQPLLAEGWELLTPVQGAGVLVQGRSVAGPVVRAAIVALQRRA